MFNNILVPLDGSELAERALELATRLAMASSANLTLLRVVPHFTILAADPMLYEEMNRLGEDEAFAYVRSIADQIDSVVKTQIVIESGPPADTIVNHAANHDVDLIVMSSNGRSGIDRWLYGSVAERVLRSGPCATTVINARGKSQMPDDVKILVPLDGSKLAEGALKTAAAISQYLNAQIYLLRVEPSPHQNLETTAMHHVFDGIEEQETKEAEAYLESIKSIMPNLQVNSGVVVTRGSVANAIIDYADENDINLIIMTSHGRTGLMRWVYGSVAEKILRGACCATMIIRSSNLK